jgi:hypothetical protein
VAPDHVRLPDSRVTPPGPARLDRAQDASGQALPERRVPGADRDAAVAGRGAVPGSPAVGGVPAGDRNRRGDQAAVQRHQLLTLPPVPARLLARAFASQSARPGSPGQSSAPASCRPGRRSASRTPGLQPAVPAEGDAGPASAGVTIRVSRPSPGRTPAASWPHQTTARTRRRAGPPGAGGAGNGDLDPDGLVGRRHGVISAFTVTLLRRGSCGRPKPAKAPRGHAAMTVGTPASPG